LVLFEVAANYYFALEVMTIKTFLSSKQKVYAIAVQV